MPSLCPTRLPRRLKILLGWVLFSKGRTLFPGDWDESGGLGVRSSSEDWRLWFRVSGDQKNICVMDFWLKHSTCLCLQAQLRSLGWAVAVKSIKGGRSPELPSRLGCAGHTCCQVEGWLGWACWWSHPLPCSFAQSTTYYLVVPSQGGQSMPLSLDLAPPVAPGCLILLEWKEFLFLPCRFFGWFNNYIDVKTDEQEKNKS